jgi:predicted AAA+ superfamily ATPase
MLNVLKEQNPWWEGKFEEDREYKKWRESKVKWIPKVMDKIELKPYSLHFIFGPRQVGKTTLLKLLVKKLLDSNIAPESIFYFRCDKLESYKELDEVLQTYFKLRSSLGIKESFIFLDEVTFPREWFRTIKFNIDTGKFDNDVLILTGSVSMYIRGEIETFAGRRGHGKDYYLYPFSFREFIRIYNPTLYDKLPSVSIENLEECFKAFAYFEEIQEAWSKYLSCGGFPLAVKEFLEFGKISMETFDTYIDWLKGDLIKLKRSVERFKKVVSVILQKIPSAFSLYSVSKDLDIKSHSMVGNYIDLLSQLFIAKVLYFIDPNNLTIDFSKNRKVVFLDPFYFQLFNRWFFSPIPDETVIVENILASHLARTFEAFYWKNEREVDVVVRGKDGLIGFESKYSSKPEISKVKVGKLKKVVTLTRDYFDEEKLAIPVSVFLACFEA